MLGLLENRLWQFDTFSSVILSHNHYLLAEPLTKAAAATRVYFQSFVLTGE